MIEFLVYLFLFWGFFQLLGNIAGMIAVKEVQEKLKDHLNKIIHEVSVEKHGEMEYWFDKETDQFLGQGKTTDELVSHLKSRFPDHIFILAPKGVLCAPKWEFVDKVDPEERFKHYANK